MATERRSGLGRRARQLGARLAAACLICSAIAASGCDRGRREPAPAPPPPAPARPKTLAVEFVVPDPGAAWRGLRPLFGAPATLLPVGPELALGAALDLGPLAAGAFDLSRPLVGGWVVAEASSNAGLLTAIPLASGSELVARLTTGASASHRLEKHGELEFVVPNSGSANAAAIAVSADRLLVGPRAAIETAGPYLSRTLSRKPAQGAPRLDAEPRALAGLARSHWNGQRARLSELAEHTRRRHGRPADLADPAAVLAALDGAVAALLGEIESAKSTALELGIAGDRLELTARLGMPEASPRFPAAVPSEHRLGELPATTLAGYWSRRDPRAAGDIGFGRFARAILGERLDEAQAAELERIERSIDAARGDQHTVASMRDFTLLWTGTVKDQPALRRALGEAVALLAKPPFREALVALFGTPQIVRDHPQLPGVRGPCDRYRFRFTPPKGRAARESPQFEAIVSVEAERFSFGLGRNAGLAVSALSVARSGPERLGSRPEVQRALARIDPNATFAAFADLRPLDPGPGAALVGSGYSRDRERVLRIELSDRALETLVRWGITP